MTAAAEGLLATNETTDPSRRQYLLTAAALGHLGQNQPKEVLELLEKYRSNEDNSELPPDLRLLVGLALSEQNGPTGSETLNGPRPAH
jgi:hypothetical protein